MYEKIMGYKVYTGNREDLIFEIKKCLLGDGLREKINIVSGNPEVLLNGVRDDTIGKFFKRDDNIIIPDGVGITILLKFLRKNFAKKIAGIDVMDEILKILNEERLSVYFIGATHESLNIAVKNIKCKYPHVDVKGYNDGYFNETEFLKIISDIKNKKPHVLFIAMGSPRQDIIIKNYMDKLECKIFMGVGGSFDLYSGKVKRAPKLMINLGLEWLYRVSNEPVRIKRLGSIPKFIFKSIGYHFRNRGADD